MNWALLTCFPLYEPLLNRTFLNQALLNQAVLKQALPKQAALYRSTLSQTPHPSTALGGRAPSLHLKFMIGFLSQSPAFYNPDIQISRSSAPSCLLVPRHLLHTAVWVSVLSIMFLTGIAA